MDFNRDVYPDCVYGKNPFHECVSACLERIAQDHGKKKTKKQGSKLLNFSGSFGRKKKQSNSQPHSPLSPKHYQSGGGYFGNANSPRIHHAIAQPVVVEKKMVSESKPGIQEHNGETGGSETRLFSFLDRSISHDNKSNDNYYTEDYDDVDDEGNNNEIGIELDLESVMSDTFVSVGKYKVRSGSSTILSDIIEKHGDIAENCKLESNSMRSRYLDCLCSLMQEIRSTPVRQMTRVKVKEMLAVLKDLESVNIEVTWLRSVLEEFAKSQEEAESEKDKHDGLVKAKREELEAQEADLVRMEKEVVEARVRIEVTRAQMVEMENERLRMEKMGFKMEKFKGKSYIDELL